MKTTDVELAERAKALPPDFASFIVSHKGETAQVKSFTGDKTYTVRIHRINPEELDVTCSCPATKICKHIVAYYAFVKGIEPAGTEPVLPEPTAKQGKQMIAEAIEMLVNGIGLLVDERTKEEK